MTTNDTFPVDPEPTQQATAADVEAYQAQVRRLADERRRLRG